MERETAPFWVWLRWPAGFYWALAFYLVIVWRVRWQSWALETLVMALMVAGNFLLLKSAVARCVLLHRKGFIWVTPRDAFYLSYLENSLKYLPSRDEIACVPGYVEGDIDCLIRFACLLNKD
jgi:hypothetical protein